MARPHTSYRTFTALILMALLAVVFGRLGYWQLDRASERDALKQAMDAGRAQPPLELRAGTPAAALRPWRPAQATGAWRHELTVLLENRNFQGRPGYWVATPLLLAGPPPQAAVLVLRGWLPRPMRPGESLAPIPAPPDTQTIRGELLDRVPRLFELWSWSDHATRLPARLPDPGAPLPRLQNLDLADYAAATGLALLPAVLAQTEPAAGAEAAADPLRREWPDPLLDSDKNRGYALQWFGFMTIAIVVCIALAWNLLRRRPRQTRK
ncbi:SURF1 family protein [Parapusillimonas granuli]|uniref:SURF1-like protein n=1 Tax=Parapusillimonas granuli TaxID=380911 RepID=A0A853FUR2_9BURK|nr:SURF1 family protein [Parapusillimonas granuli]MBB5216202.1 cytochrome oxidase assembly protein ShyY1 [Parapusillimonas granuli]NYT47879.1 SURF1 family protein [Parapusillimonas granuli]